MMLASSVALASDADLFSGESLVALLALTLMEIVLGIDNIVFIAIITGRLPQERRSFARRVGLVLAMAMRIILLLGIGWLLKLDAPLFQLSQLAPIDSIAAWFEQKEEIDRVNGRDLILFGGGLFLLYTAVREIHHKLEGDEQEHEVAELPVDQDAVAAGTEPQVAPSPAGVTVSGVLFRIAFMDVIFSLDSVLTAVGMADHVPIMVAAVVISVGVMIAFANQISEFVQDHPTVKMLALSFLILISVVLISEATGTPINKGYIYFAMAFSLGVEFLNLRMHLKRARPSHGEGETGSPLEASCVNDR